MDLAVQTSEWVELDSFDREDPVEFERPASFPEILLAWDEATDGMNRKEMVEAIGSAGGPVSIGSHDFFVLYGVGRSGGASHSFSDMSASPRPNRGIVWYPGASTSTSSGALKGAMYTLLHELGHHWLVSSSMKVNGRSTLNSVEFTKEVNAGKHRFPGPPFRGRQGSHWTPYLQSDDSVMDGTGYDRSGPSVGSDHAFWDSEDFTRLSVQLPGEPLVEVNPTYSDLDLYMMGAKPASDCYPSTGGRFFWIEPRVVGPLKYRAGLFVEFDDGTHLHFGFHREHDRLAVARPTSLVTTQDLPSSFDPYSLPMGGVALRIVREGNIYKFQARIDDRPQTGCATIALVLLDALLKRDESSPKPESFDLFDDLNVGSGPGTFQDWETLTTVSESKTPVKIGYMLRREAKFLVDAEFSPIEILDLDTNTRSKPEIDTSLFSIAPTTGDGKGHLILMRAGGRHWEDRHGRHHLMAPYASVTAANKLIQRSAGHFDWSPTDDGTPKVVYEPPEGDFAFATSSKIHSAVIVPWAGGAASGKHIVGHEKSARVTDVGLRSGFSNKQSAPPGDTYKIAHVLVAERRSDITDALIEATDTRRRYFDAAFEEATDGLRMLDSSL